MNDKLNIYPGHTAPVQHPDKAATQAGKARRISSSALFNGSKELLIAHANDCYVLRHTNQGKLILTKQVL